MWNSLIKLIVFSFFSLLLCVNDSFGQSCKDLFQSAGGSKQSHQQENINFQNADPKPIKSYILEKLQELRLEYKVIKDIRSLEIFLTEKDGRRGVMQFEVFGRLLEYFRGKGEKGTESDKIHKTEFGDQFLKLFAQIKEIEDAMGKYGEIVETIEAIETYDTAASTRKSKDQEGVNSEIPTHSLSGLKEQLEEKRIRSLNNVYNLLIKKGWLVSVKSKKDFFKDFSNELEALPWPKTDEANFRNLYESMLTRFNIYHDKMNTEINSRIEENVWNYDANMENGLHEARRLLRSLLIAVNTYPYGFSWTRKLDGHFSLTDVSPLAQHLVESAYEKAVKDKNWILNLAVRKEGTVEISPESEFLLMSLVDKIGKLKGQAETYFKLTAEIKEYLQSGHRIYLGQGKGFLTKKSSDEEIQSYLVELSSLLDVNHKLYLAEVFPLSTSPNYSSRDPFSVFRLKTMELLDAYYAVEPIQDFIDGAQTAHQFWFDQKNLRDQEKKK